MKKVLLTSSLFSLLLWGCGEEFLQRDPLVVQTADTFFRTEDHAIQATNAVYNMLRRWETHVFSYIGMTDIVSDDADKGSTPNDATFLLELDNFTFDASNVAPQTVWRGYYSAIYRANLAIERIPEIEMNDALKQRLLGENRFLRAYFYFNLVRWFGDVPLILRPLNPDEYEQSRTPEAQVYAQIIDDLTFAASVLPEKGAYPSSELGRATRGAALGYLAKVHLTLGNWEEARDFAEDVIESGEYMLLPDYAQIFMPEGEHSSESVFEISTVALGTGNGGSQYNEVQGVRGTPNLGWGFNSPSNDLLAAFRPTDPRLEATVLFLGETLPDGSEVVVGDPGVVNQRHNQKAWAPRGPGGNGNGGGNIRVLRYADIILIAAEAHNELGNTMRALELANLVRRRARGSLPPAFLPDITANSQEDAREKIWLERRLELALEQHRWFDLRRTGRVAERMLAVGKTRFMPGKNELFPIPQAEIDLSGGALVQNPGYE